MTWDMKIASIARKANEERRAVSSRRRVSPILNAAATIRPDFGPKTIPFAGWATFAALLAAWQLIAWRQADAILLPSPIDVAAALRDMIGTGELQTDLAASLGRLVAGWAVGAGLGVLTGFAISLFPLARSSVLPLVNALREDVKALAGARQA